MQMLNWFYTYASKMKNAHEDSMWSYRLQIYIKFWFNANVYSVCMVSKKETHPKAGCEAFGVCRMIRILYLSVCY